MKKFFAAVLAMTIGASAFAGPVEREIKETLVYDYKASFKRIDAQYKVKTLDKIKVVTDAYAVKSDSIKGYVTIPACFECDNLNGMYNFRRSATGTAYLTRTGDKYSKKANLPFVVKTDAKVDGAIFGAFVRLKGEDTSEPLKSVKDAKKAWMTLYFDLNETELATYKDLKSTYVLKNVDVLRDPYTQEEVGLDFDFFGVDNEGAGEVWNAGFGTAKIMSWKEAGELGWCGDTEGKEGSCQMITSISGSMIGNPAYQGACETIPMWDVCYNQKEGESKNLVQVHQATLAGTWNLKYNKALTKAADKEKAILAKLKATPNDVIDLTLTVAP